jgi:hypothetical protein
MEQLVISDYKNYINRSVLGWVIIDSVEYPSLYAIVLKKNDSENLFYIRRTIIKGSVLRLDEDVYELWYKTFEESRLLNSTDILNIDIVISKMEELIEKYSSYE